MVQIQEISQVSTLHTPAATNGIAATELRLGLIYDSEKKAQDIKLSG